MSLVAQSALRAAGITKTRWSPIGVGYARGFFVTTRLERIDDDGAPVKAPEARWSSAFPAAPELRWLEEADAMRLPAAGRNRVLLIAFTDLPVARPPHSAPRWNEETVLYGSGLSAAGFPYGRQISSAYRLDVFAYEYQGDGRGEGRFVSVGSSAKLEPTVSGLLR